jgi:two-component system chemotaxis response regulator CheB
MKTINVIIVDDSKVSTKLLHAILEAEPDINILACATDGEAAVKLTKKLKPDLITMDIFMPKMNGVEATRAIMKECPTPILVISSHANDQESEFVFNALKAGAMSIIEKPKGVLDPDFIKTKRHILNSIRTLADVHVMQRHYTIIPQKLKPMSISPQPTSAKICALGASTGGPAALQLILSALPAHFSIPIVVTQHITKGFLPGLLNWLQGSCKLKLTIAKDRQPLLPGNVYFADDNTHLTIKKSNAPMALLDNAPPIDQFRPSINALFASIAKSYPGAAIGGLLTGMGQDGAQGLLEMKEAGCTTFTQSENTCVVYGMPAVAVALHATNCSLDLGNIPQFLTTLIGKGVKL